ncbi:histone PARylation factor 1 [Lampetra fluviatilis]
MSARVKRSARETKSSGKRARIEVPTTTTSSTITTSSTTSTSSGQGHNKEEEAAALMLPAVSSLYGGLPAPRDLVPLWGLCLQLAPHSPLDAMAPLGLHLVGPFEVLSGKHLGGALSGPPPQLLHLHWRYWYDPPELQTVARGDSDSQTHLGYYRDSPGELPVFVGESVASRGCTITPLGDNIFAALKCVADRKIRSAKSTSSKSSSTSSIASISSVRDALIATATRLGFSLETKSPSIAARNKRVVSRLFHGAGIVVPVDDKDVGYRELPHSPAELRRLCEAVVRCEDDAGRVAAFAPLQELSTLVQFANDESDYGMGLEFGLNLFCHGSHFFHKLAGRTLRLSYSLLKRDAFGDIVSAHLAQRSRQPLNLLP